MARVRERIADGRVLSLIRSFLDQEVMDGLACYTPETGTPQGAVLSPLLANVYLNPLDHEMAAGERFEFLGYLIKQHKGHIRRFPRDKSFTKRHRAVRRYTHRANGHSLERLIANINPVLRGWYAYFAESYYTVFKDVDG